MKLSDRLRNARKSLRLSQKSVAKILGVGQKQVSDYEAGNPEPSLEHVLLLEERVVQSDTVSSQLPRYTTVTI